MSPHSLLSLVSLKVLPYVISRRFFPATVASCMLVMDTFINDKCISGMNIFIRNAALCFVKSALQMQLNLWSSLYAQGNCHDETGLKQRRFTIYSRQISIQSGSNQSRNI